MLLPSTALFILVFTVIAECDSKCEVQRQVVNCSNRNFNSIPARSEEFNVSIYHLDFSHNHIHDLVGISNWSEVVTLDLSFNLLNTLADEDFKDFKDLRELSLKHNSINKWNLWNWSQSFPSLQMLDISQNRNLGKARSFESAFRGITNSEVSSLNASDISWTKPSLDFFKNFSSLEHLNLSSNCLSHIPILPINIKIVDLSHNCIEHIESNSFSIAHSLETLSLNHNINLEQIRSDSFVALPNLTDISFVHCNKLNHVPSDVFRYNLKLRTVSFRYCNFSTLQVELEKTFQRLDQVDLTDNPWHCNASIKWFGNLIKHQVTDFSPNFRCRKPGDKLMEDYLGPKVQRNIRLALAATCVLLALALVAAISYSCRMEARRRRALAASYTPLGRKVNPPHNQDITTTTVL